MFLHINISIFSINPLPFSAHSSLSYKLNLKEPNPNDLYNYMKNRKENPKYRHTKTQNGKLYIAYFPSLKQKKSRLLFITEFRMKD